MSITTPALLAIRHSFKKYLADISPGEVVQVGCSGGADSMALTFALHQEALNLKFDLIPVVVDHGLQAGSADIAEDTKQKIRSWGIEEIFLGRAQVTLTDGLEASARRARYQIFQQAIDTFPTRKFFLAHTLNDQAESVLLGLARGSGARSLSGMADINGVFVRPLLTISRTTTEQACGEVGIEYWVDPHNSNEEFTRVRARKNILPLMERNLGPGITQALAKSARLLREDDQALESWASQISNLEIELLAAIPKAVRARVLRRVIYEAGAPFGSLSAEHIEPVEALISDWHGQGEVSLPGGVKVARISGRLSLSTHPKGEPWT
jgi:tRNA(Ile)-lysidine synthase